MSAATTRQLFVSIDWDFFLWRGCEALDDKITIFPGTPRAAEISAVHLFDWGHSERQSALLQEILWQVRWNGFTSCGLDPREVAGFRGLRPLKFQETLARIHPLEGTLSVADSHAMGFLAVEKCVDTTRRPVNVVHFDAHSDLGYRGDRAWNVDCESWLRQAMRVGYVENVLVVYPDWRDDGDRPSVRAAQREFGDRVRSTTWSLWAPGRRKLPATAMMVARSSAWTPPWMDVDFKDFTAALAPTSICLDCLHSSVKVGDHDGCRPRRWIPPTMEVFK